MKDNPVSANYGIFPLPNTDTDLFEKFYPYINTRTGVNAKMKSKSGRKFIIIAYQNWITLDFIEKLIFGFEQSQE